MTTVSKVICFRGKNIVSKLVYYKKKNGKVESPGVKQNKI